MGKRLVQALVYGVFGSIFVPLAGTVLLLPACLLFLGVSFLPLWSGLIYAMPITLVGVPLVDYSVSTSLSWQAIPTFGAVIFALRGALMRPDGGKKFNDIRLLPRFYRVVFLWMLRGAVVCGVWGAILGAISLWKSGDAISGALLGSFGGTVCGEIVGSLIGAARGAFSTLPSLPIVARGVPALKRR